MSPMVRAMDVDMGRVPDIATRHRQGVPHD